LAAARDLSVKKTKRAHCSAPFLFKRESLGAIYGLDHASPEPATSIGRSRKSVSLSAMTSQYFIGGMMPESARAQQNVHAVWTAPSVVRGNHHHVRGTEVTLVFGPALVRYRDANGIQDVQITLECHCEVRRARNWRMPKKYLDGAR